MAKLYRHKVHGWQLNYTLYYPDGTERIRYRTLRRKGEAGDLLEEAERLERKCIRGELSRQDALRCQRLGLISTDDAAALYGAAVEPITLDSLARTLLADSRVENRAKTHESNEYRVQTLLAWFGRERTANTITEEDVKEYRAHRLQCVPVNDRRSGRHITPATVNKEVNKLCQMLDIALTRGAIDRNPARSVRPLKEDLGRLPRALSRDEVARLLDAAATFPELLGKRARDIMMLYLYTGMRREELIMQRWEDVDLPARKIRIQGDLEGGWSPKARKARVIGIARQIEPIIEALPYQGAYLLGGEAPLCNPESMSRAFRAIRDKAKLPRSLSLHTLRHTYITHLIERGVNLKRVQYLAGHARISTTERYTHLVSTDEVVEDRLAF